MLYRPPSGGHLVRPDAGRVDEFESSYSRLIRVKIFTAMALKKNAARFGGAGILPAILHGIPDNKPAGHSCVRTSGTPAAQAYS